MEFNLYKVSGYEEAILSLRMSKGKFYSPKIAKDIQNLVYVLTNEQGFLNTEQQYNVKLSLVDYSNNNKVTGNYEKDLNEFKRLLGLTLNNAMGEHNHHTLMKYIDISFFTDGLHRGAQDDLDSHAIAFNNRITRFSSRLAVIDKQEVSEWYQDKIIPFDKVIKVFGVDVPQQIESGGDIFEYTPFGYVLQKYNKIHEDNGLRKDVLRGGMNLGMPSNALWKTDLFNLRYVYQMRSKLTKAAPELRIGMEQLADQIEQSIPVFGEKFRYIFTDTKQWEHMNRAKTVTSEEYRLLQSLKEK